MEVKQGVEVQGQLWSPDALPENVDVGGFFSCLFSSAYSDVVFVIGVERKSFLAHKVLLAARSTYFHKLFTEDKVFSLFVNIKSKTGFGSEH